MNSTVCECVLSYNRLAYRLSIILYDLWPLFIHLMELFNWTTSRMNYPSLVAGTWKLTLWMVLQLKASYTRAHRMVRKLLANSSQTKCVYVWTGLRTCAAPSANGSHTVCREPKFVGFLRKLKENWMRQVSFPRTGCLLLASGLRKIN